VQPPEPFNPGGTSGHPDVQEIRATVATLVDELGADALVELLQTFLAEAPERLAEFRALAGGSDQEGLRRAAHSFRGSVALFGATVLETAVLRLEQAARHRDLKVQPAAAEEIATAYGQIRPELEERLRSLSAGDSQ